MAVYPSSIKFEIKINGLWEDITKDVILEQSIEQGIRGNSQKDRIASTGSMKFVLNNQTGIYYPSLPASKVGWKKGIPIRLIISYDGESFVKFYGYVADIKVDNTLTYQRMNVTAVDWLEFASTNPLSLDVQYDENIVTGVQAILDKMPIKPLNTKYLTPEDTFQIIFDDVSSTTKAMTEFAKLAYSEMGYIYLKADKERGETLVVEGRRSRNNNSEITEIPVGASVADYLIEEAESFLITEDESFTLVLDESQQVDFVDITQDINVKYGDNLSNRVVISSYPRRVDESFQVLYSINSPIAIAPGEKKEAVSVNYKDPYNFASNVSGTNMQNPVATTDYLMNTLNDGSGTNLTANLSVNVTFYSNKAVFTLENTGAVSGYVTKLQFRGKGVYTYDESEYIAEDEESINSYGYSELRISQKYTSSVYNSASLAGVLLNQNKEPRIDLYSVSFLANYKDSLMQAFLYYGIGDLIRIKNSKIGIDNYFYIQAVKFSLQPGGIIRFSYVVKEALSLNEIYWILGTSTLGVDTILGY